SEATGKEAREKEPGSQDVPLQQPSTACYQGSQGARGLLALGTLASSFQYANSSSDLDPENATEAIKYAIKATKINDAKTLGKIGRDPDYPLEGTYLQTADIDVPKDFQSIGNAKNPFTGEFHGQCNTIRGLSKCFVDTLKNGKIEHLRFTDAEIKGSDVTGLVACVVDDNGEVKDIGAEKVKITSTGYGSHVGIGGGKVSGKVFNITARGCDVETKGSEAYAGIGGGMLLERCATPWR
ncbi:hypothetical protein, partial [Endozoicomonas acroporae]|uniref:hypothetical protein n=2 Tax=Endozoicomonas acroporae TaxID=1701104 RepID=UPI0019D566F5